ncbi:unnamed protein product [Schistosoma curassoni]|uniref:Transmembrane protein n=1 Tax=Schistosoma curassoni TaxID=6186 RepID=A0A183KHJ3_9TREM|nr:unnamed protein product [Schistosoma curassoni]
MKDSVMVLIGLYSQMVMLYAVGQINKVVCNLKGFVDRLDVAVVVLVYYYYYRYHSINIAYAAHFGHNSLSDNSNVNNWDNDP